MSASSVTGTGPGAANNKTTKELSILTSGHAIVEAGWIHVNSGVTSPPAPLSSVVFGKPLPGDYTNYVVQLTPYNGTNAYLASFIENDAGDFAGFYVAGEDECEAMYLVVKIGAQVVDL